MRLQQNGLVEDQAENPSTLLNGSEENNNCQVTIKQTNAESDVIVKCNEDEVKTLSKRFRHVVCMTNLEDTALVRCISHNLYCNC